MYTREDLQAVNEAIPTVEIKGKPYPLVVSKVAAFRTLLPGGGISTEVTSCGGGECTVVATITDETGQVIATGTAHEKESDGYINRTSFIENCETSAVGRALSFAGFGNDQTLASAEELTEALSGQQAIKIEEAAMDLINHPKTNKMRLFKLAAKEVYKSYGLGKDSTEADYGKALNQFMDDLERARDGQ